MKIKVKVKPGARKQEIKEISQGEFEVKLKERAEDNKANKELIHLLARYFKVGIKDIKIKSPKSRVKLIEVKE